MEKTLIDYDLDYKNGFKNTCECSKCGNKFNLDFTIIGAVGYDFNIEFICEKCSQNLKLRMNCKPMDSNGNEIIYSCNECDETKGGECGSSDGCCGCICHKSRVKRKRCIRKFKKFVPGKKKKRVY